MPVGDQAAVVAGPGQVHAQHGEGLGPRLVVRQEPAAGVGLQAGHVAAEDEHRPAPALEPGRGGHDRVAGAELGLLGDKAEARPRGKGPPHPLGLVAHHHQGAARAQLRGQVQAVGQKRPSAQGVQDLGQVRLHAGALARRQDDHGQAG